MSRVASRDLRVWVLLPVAVLVVSGTAAGCSTSSKPAYCKDASQLKSAVKRLGEGRRGEERDWLTNDRARHGED